MRYLVLPFCALLLAACGQDAKIVQGPSGSVGAPGAPGSPGSPGPGPSPSPDPYAVVAEIVPCGQQGSNNEVLQVLADGEIQAVLNKNGQAYLEILAPGTYYTSDSKHCKFTIHADNTVTW